MHVVLTKITDKRIIPQEHPEKQETKKKVKKARRKKERKTSIQIKLETAA